MVDLQTTERQTLRINEVMEIFTVSRRTVYYWISSKKLLAIRVGWNGAFRVPVEEVRRLRYPAADPLAADCTQSPVRPS